MVTLEGAADTWLVSGSGQAVKLCMQRELYDVCNAVLNLHDTYQQCPSCRLTRTLPDLGKRANILRWSLLEAAKRRLLYGLAGFGLPMQAPAGGQVRTLCFDFLEDQRTNPGVYEEFVTTGHDYGVITVNVLEADDVQRVWQRELSSERYRTVLGHMRHEVGHFYFEMLTQDRPTFIRLFGDPAKPYERALQSYYDNGALPGWQQGHISAYASSHPLEDWAECFAHYLHMADTLETACARQLLAPIPGNTDFEKLLAVWDDFSVTLNELNRGLGLNDAYPFTVTPVVADKLRYVHAAIQRVTGR